MEQDSRLIERFKNKDRSAFDEIFARYHKPVYYYLYKLIQNSGSAEDITQDTFVKVYKSLDKVDDSLKLSPWIYRIAHNTFIDYVRKNKVKLEPIDCTEYDNKLMSSNSEDDPEASFMNKELQVRINKTMSKISSRYKSILILRDYNSLSYKEIAQVLELSEAAVKSLIHRARLEFQRIYKEL